MESTTQMHSSKQINMSTYRELNAKVYNTTTGEIDLKVDKEAARAYFLEEVNPKTVFFTTLKEKLDYLVEHEYYEPKVLNLYSDEFLKRLWQKANAFKKRFESFFGAYKFYSSYALKTFDGKNYLERFEDRVCMVALDSAQGDENYAEYLMQEIMSGRYQPATPTFLNAGKAQRGELVSCFLLGIEDDLNSIGRAINSSLQLSKRGGGVALNLTDIRATGDPIKKIENQSSGVVPVMKLLEDSFSYANQLGARQGAGAVYLHAHHPDIIRFLDTKKENADEKVRIKTLSLGIIMPDITFELAKKGENMYLFSPYDVQRVYGRPFSEVDITKEYYSMVDNANIRKSKIDARELLAEIASVQFQSGYPYMLFIDNANAQNPIDGIIKMSNLCSEILQVQEPSVVDEEQEYTTLGKDISCNLGSMNIAKLMDSPNFGRSVEIAIRALTAVSDQSNIRSVPTVASGNRRSHAVGLGAMNLHGALAKNGIMYGSPEALDFTSIYFYTVAFHAISASNKIARERGESFDGFERSKYATGEFFEKYITQSWVPEFPKVKELFKDIHVPTQSDWEQLKNDVAEFGMYNQNLQAIPPTGSISYINNSVPSILPATARVESRKEGKLGLAYYPAPHLSEENFDLFQNAYEIGNKAIINTYAVAQQHIDQGMSLTLFLKDTDESKKLTSMQRYAWSKGIKTIYYVRVQTSSVYDGKANFQECISCAV